MHMDLAELVMMCCLVQYSHVLIVPLQQPSDSFCTSQDVNKTNCGKVVNILVRALVRPADGTTLNTVMYSL